MSLPWREAAGIQRERERLRAAWWRGFRAGLKRAQEVREQAQRTAQMPPAAPPAEDGAMEASA